MATIILPIERDVLPALQHDDVASLERLFREHYASLHDEARAALRGGSAYAATVSPIVERAFIAAWERRAEFGCPEALAEYLHAAVHRGVARERARRAAARRFEAHDGGPVRTSALAARECTVDDAWERVAAAVHADDLETQAATDAAAHAGGEARRHAAAAHLSRLARRRSWLVRAAVTALAASVGGWPRFVGKTLVLRNAADRPARGGARRTR
jgi:DNA-directed RNA polymerase specialized sigma24 family protein